MPKLPNKNDSKQWRVKRRNDGWYLTGLPRDCYPDGEMGPYKDKADLVEDREGLVRFLTVDQHE